MKVAIRDVSTLRGLKPLEIAAYLRAKGWRQEGEFDGKASLWLLRPEVGEEVDVTLPLRQDLGDFALRMSEILGTLARVEDRSQLDIIQDLLTVTSDLIRVRASSRDHDDGTLPLEQAVEFVERSRDLMLAAACATLNKRPYFWPPQAVSGDGLPAPVAHGPDWRGKLRFDNLVAGYAGITRAARRAP